MRSILFKQICAHENDNVCKKIKALIKDRLFPYTDINNIEFGELEINDFSICFWANILNKSASKSIYVKIPKADLYKKKHRNILPLSDKDVQLAEDEYNSLVCLSNYWCNDDINVRFVKPLAFLKEYNAIITERFYAKHFFKMYRQYDLRSRLKKQTDSVRLIMTRLGKSLSKFHETKISECEFDIGSVLNKMQNICLQLKSLDIHSEAFINNLIFRLGKINKISIITHTTNTLKGFDIRQVFVDTDGTLFLLDPGKMKIDYKEMDLARFIVTCRILYWGSMLFFLRMSPNVSCEESFIRAYYGNNKVQDKLLCLLIIKELLKHWRMAYVVLELKQWPSLLKKLLKRTYIDPFYKGQIRVELAKFEIN